MTVDTMHATCGIAALVLTLAGLVLAQFFGLRDTGLVMVLLGIAAAGATGALYVIVRQARANNPTHQERTQ